MPDIIYSIKVNRSKLSNLLVPRVPIQTLELKLGANRIINATSVNPFISKVLKVTQGSIEIKTQSRTFNKSHA